MLYYIRYLV